MENVPYQEWGESYIIILCMYGPWFMSTCKIFRMLLLACEGLSGVIIPLKIGDLFIYMWTFIFHYSLWLSCCCVCLEINLISHSTKQKPLVNWSLLTLSRKFNVYPLWIRLSLTYLKFLWVQLGHTNLSSPVFMTRESKTMSK